MVDALIVSGKGASSNLYVKEAIEVVDEECAEEEDVLEEEEMTSLGAKKKEPELVLHYEIKEGSLKSCLNINSPG